jgi:muramoyltetrapeptide carboxypeptidase
MLEIALMMERIYPSPLKPGDNICVVAVSGSVAELHQNLINKAVDVLRSLELAVSFSAHSMEKRKTGAADLENRLADLHDAFANPEVAAILIGVGGTNAIEMLPYMDFDLIRAHPKPICGFSDATVILNAIYSRTGIITYYGPMLFSFVVNIDPDYTLDYLRNALFLRSAYTLTPAIKWGNYTDLHSDMVNKGYQVIRKGDADGLLVGGHLPSLNLLQGTVYLPELEDAILFIEICERYGKSTIDKLGQYLGALMLQKGADKVRGLLVGRLVNDDTVTTDDLKNALLSRADLKDIPIIINVDFGHTTPMVTLPVGGRINILKSKMIISNTE